MVKHIIIWTFKSELTDGEKRAAAEKIKASLEGLSGKIQGMTGIKVNIDLLPSSTGDIILDTEFTDESALEAYQVNPDHLAAAAYVRSVVSDRKCADYKC